MALVLSHETGWNIAAITISVIKSQTAGGETGAELRKIERWVWRKCCKEIKRSNRRTHIQSHSEARNPSHFEYDLKWRSQLKSKVTAYYKREGQTNSRFLHGPLAGLGLLGPAAQEYTHGEDEHQERDSRRRGHQHEAAITGLVPGGILCGTDRSDMKGNMHHTDSEISKTMSSSPPGKTSKGNLLFVCGRKGCLSDGYAAVRSTDLQEVWFICLIIPFMCIYFPVKYNICRFWGPYVWWTK